MSRFFAGLLAASIVLGGVTDPVRAAPTTFVRPVAESGTPQIAPVRYRHRRYRRRYRRHGGDAAAAALFGAVVGGILSNPCIYGGCGDYGGYYGGPWYGGGGGRFHRGGFHGGRFHGGGGFHGGGFHGGSHGGGRRR